VPRPVSRGRGHSGGRSRYNCERDVASERSGHSCRKRSASSGRGLWRGKFPVAEKRAALLAHADQRDTLVKKVHGKKKTKKPKSPKPSFPAEAGKSVFRKVPRDGGHEKCGAGKFVRREESREAKLRRCQLRSRPRTPARQSEFRDQDSKLLRPIELEGRRISER